MPPSDSSAPEFREWQIAAVRLLQGVIYADDERLWGIVLNWRSQLDAYLARLGLLLVLDEPEGYAFVRQWTEDELPEGYESLPRLIRRTSLGYNATLLAVILRDEYQRFEEQELHDERCVIEIDPLFDQWKSLVAGRRDEVRQKKDLSAALSKLEELGFVKRFGDNPESWEIRRILKARLPASELETVKQQLSEAAAARTGGEEHADA